MKPETYTYGSYDEDVVVNAHQDQKVPEDFLWIHTNPVYKAAAGIMYRIVISIGYVYCRLVLHMQIADNQALRAYTAGGCFVYCNHTQPVGDVVLPVYSSRPRRIYTVISPANLGLPVIGRILPAIGGLPIPDNVRQMADFTQAIHQRAQEGNRIVIYPEAHVWPYYTKIRPYAATAFRYPVEEQMPAFAMTTTYQKRRWGKRPKAVIYVDGPFWPDTTLKKRNQREKLRDQVLAAMQERSKNNNCEYVIYQQRERSI